VAAAYAAGGKVAILETVGTSTHFAAVAVTGGINGGTRGIGVQ